jgi:hypothetical protein
MEESEQNSYFTRDYEEGLAIGCINIQTLIVNDFPTLTDECVIVSQIVVHFYFKTQHQEFMTKQ